ncbi:hypothetical protein ACSQ67_014969 [Phaseolus vulgaris]
MILPCCRKIMANAWTEDQIAIFHEAFDVVDKDSDGFITVEELISIVQSLDGNTPKEEVQEKISKVDIDGKGSVNFEEFLNVIGMTMKLRHVMMKLGERLTEEEVEQMIREADLDGDGRVSYEEFARFMSLN